MIKQLFFVTALILLILSSVYAEEEKYSNPTLGFSVVKPANWHFITAEENLDSITRTEYKDEATKEMLLKYTTAPLVAMTKYKEPYEDVSPSFKVNIKPLNNFDASNPKAILEVLVAPISKMFQDFEIVQGPENTVINGGNAGYIKINYSMKVSDGRIFPICSELWVIPRKNYFFVVGAGTRQDEKTGTRIEIRSIMDSLVVEN